MRSHTVHTHAHRRLEFVARMAKVVEMISNKDHALVFKTPVTDAMVCVCVCVGMGGGVVKGTAGVW